jgi:glycosyltransferase involved in cell wall biosynthesis
MSGVEWHAHPVACDVLYLSYTGVDDCIDYHQFARDVITTVHDPCELSRFEDRLDWRAKPLLPLDFTRFDRVSAISAELVTLLRTEYQLPVARTPTWPTHAEALAQRADPTRRRAAVQAISSTNVPEFFTGVRIVKRFRRIASYLRDHHGRLSLAQLGGLAVIRRRKNIRLLRQLGDAFAGRSDVHCNFRFGRGSPIARAAYEQQLLDADIYVCTSNMEGGPLPVLESVFAGLAVVSTPVGQVEEWVHHGENGWICRTQSDFRLAIDRYARDRELLAEHRSKSLALAAAARFPAEPWVRFLTGIPDSTAA